MRRIGVILLAAAVALLVAACGSSGPREVPDDAVAVVGDQTITKAQWQALLDQTRRNLVATQRPFPKPGTVELANLRANATQFLIQSSEYEQEAKKLGVEVTDKDVDQRLDEIKKQYYGNPPGQKPATPAQMEKRYRAALKQQGFTDEEVRRGIKLRLLQEKVFEKVTSDVKVSDDDVKAYYEKHKKEYETPAQPASRDARHILVKKKALADRLYAELKAHPNRFAKLAKKYSIDTSSAQNGGTLAPGVVVKGRLLPEFEQVVFSIKPHVISKPVHTRDGWHIIEALGPVRAGTPAKPTPFSQVKDAIRQTLLSQKKQQKMNGWLADTKKSYCKKIAYQRGFAPPPGQDPCKASSSTSGSTTTG